MAHTIKYPSDFLKLSFDQELKTLAGFRNPVIKLFSCLSTHYPHIQVSARTLSNKSGISPTDIHFYLKWLSDYGIIKIDKREKTHIYYLHNPSMQDLKQKSLGFARQNIYAFSKNQLKKTCHQKKFSQNDVSSFFSDVSLKSNDVSSNNYNMCPDLMTQSNSISNNQSNDKVIVGVTSMLNNDIYAKNDTSEKMTHENNDTSINTLTQIINNLLNKIEDLNLKIETLSKTNNARIDKLGLRQNEMNTLLTTIEHNVSFIMSNQTKQQKQMVNLAPALASRMPTTDKPQITITDIDVAEFMPSMGSINLLKQYFNSTDEQVYQQIQAFRCYVKDKLTDPNNKINNLQTYFERAVTSKWACLEISKEPLKSFKEQDLDRNIKLKQQIRGMREAVEELKRNPNSNIAGLSFLNSTEIIEDDEIPSTSQILEKRKTADSEFMHLNHVLNSCVNKVLVKGEVYA